MCDDLFWTFVRDRLNIVGFPPRWNHVLTPDLYKHRHETDTDLLIFTPHSKEDTESACFTRNWNIPARIWTLSSSAVCCVAVSVAPLCPKTWLELSEMPGQITTAVSISVATAPAAPICLFAHCQQVQRMAELKLNQLCCVTADYRTLFQTHPQCVAYNNPLCNKWRPDMISAVSTICHRIQMSPEFKFIHIHGNWFWWLQPAHVPFLI